MLIDLDEVRAGNPAEDVGNFVARLFVDGQLEPSRRDEAAQLASHFVESYRQAAGRPLRQSELRAWVALSLPQLSVMPFRRFEPNWPRQVASLVHLARAAAEGRLC